MPDDRSFRWTVALILFGVLFLGVSDTQLIPPLLPLIAADVDTTAGRAGIIVTSYSLAAGVFALLAGLISDRIGRKKVLIAGLTLFVLSSFLTYHVSSFRALFILRTFTGLAAGTLSTCALSLAGDYYPYAQRGRAMGIISMAYFAAFAAGVPVAAFVAARMGWQTVFGGLAAGAFVMLLIAAAALPAATVPEARTFSPRGLLRHFGKTDRVAGMAAAFLTSGGVVGFLTYVGAWLATEQGIRVEHIGLLFMVSGLAAIAASPLSGWLSDHTGKRRVIVWANIALTILFLVVSQLDWSLWLVAGIALLSIAASARQAPLHAVTTELTGPEARGEYIALRNAASQLGIAAVATASAYAFDFGGFTAVALIASFVTLLVPVACLWIPEPKQTG